MPSFLRWGVVVVALLAPVTAGAQQWKELYESGDIFRALDVLQPLVFESDPLDQDVDPMAPLYLATYYMHGFRVDKDPLFVCGLGMTSQRYAHMRPRYPEPLRLAIDAFVEKNCSGLTPEDRTAAMRVTTCPNFGLVGQTIQVGTSDWLEVTRSNFIIDHEGQRTETPLYFGPTSCAQHVLPLRATSVSLPGGGVRLLVELFAWIPGRRPDDGILRHGLFWTVYEVLEGGIEPVGGWSVAEEPGSAWPAKPVPEKVRITFHVGADGEVSYRLQDAAGREKTDTLRPQAEVLKAIRAQRARK